MKKWIENTAVVLFLIIFLGPTLFALGMACEPIGNIIFSFCFGERYYQVTRAKVQMGGKINMLPVYKAADKPFLLLGPVDFGEDGDDFFFVNKTQVIRSSTDKCGEAWTRIFRVLFIMDDLSNEQNRIRAPIWDDIRCDPESSISFDETTKRYRYHFRIDNLQKTVSFELQSSLFTKDMESAETQL